MKIMRLLLDDCRAGVVGWVIYCVGEALRGAKRDVKMTLKKIEEVNSTVEQLTSEIKLLREDLRKSGAIKKPESPILWLRDVFFQPEPYICGGWIGESNILHAIFLLNM